MVAITKSPGSGIVLTYTILSIFTIALFLQYLTPLIRRELPGIQGGLVSAVAILLLISPFLRAMMMKKNHSEEFQYLWNDSKIQPGTARVAYRAAYSLVYRHRDVCHFQPS